MANEKILSRANEALFAALTAATRDVTLVSPFMTIQTAKQLAYAASRSSASWSLLTRLNPSAVAGGFLTVDGMRALLEAGVTILDLDHLHAKVYLVDDDFGMVGSANLTSSALGSSSTPNIELSVQLDGDSLRETRRFVAQWQAASSPVNAARLDELEVLARSLPRAVVVSSVNDELGSVAQLIADAGNVGLWVKAQYGEPQPDAWRGEYWFSSSKRGKPSFKPGDLVLIYAKSTRECYAVVEVTSEPHFDPEFVVDQGYPEVDGARWPWVNETVPRLIPSADQTVSLAALGFTGQGLQGGHRRLGLPEFVSAVGALSGETDLI